MFVLFASFVTCDARNGTNIDEISPESDSISDPVFTPDGGELDSGSTVTISSPTDGTMIYYTTDGTSNPVGDGSANTEAKYTNPILINSDTVIKAIAVNTEMTKKSSVVERSFTVKPIVVKKPNAPTNINFRKDETNPNTTVEVSWAESKIDGEHDAPTEYIVCYKKGSGASVSITDNPHKEFENTKSIISTLQEDTIYTFAVFGKNSAGNSEALVGKYKNFIPPSNPSFNPDGESFEDYNKTIKIITDPCVSTFYTFDGSDPEVPNLENGAFARPNEPTKLYQNPIRAGDVSNNNYCPDNCLCIIKAISAKICNDDGSILKSDIVESKSFDFSFGC